MYYFASDIHLGLHAGQLAACREQLFVRWLDRAAHDAEAIYLVGDVFDFWFEYKRVIPKGFSRVLGKLSELTDRGIAIHFFPGNHDVWAFDYLRTECGVTLHHTGGEMLDIGGTTVFIGHGDTLGPRTVKQRMLNRLFRNHTVQRIFATLVHPDTAMRFGQWWSGSNRKSRPTAHLFRGLQEPIIHFAQQYSNSHPEIQLFVFGHIHCFEQITLAGGAQAAILGEWIDSGTYGTLDRGTFQLHRIDSEITPCTQHS